MTSTTEQKVWFITGTSRGFGRVWAEAALERGDRVAATARDRSTLADLEQRHGDAVLALELDVTDKAAVETAVTAAHEAFGRLDVVVNNAGYGLSGAVEEVSEAQARRQLDTNVLGALWVTQAALPILRAQGSGHIVQVSSIGGVAAFPLMGLYHASKWALEGFSQALAGEVAELGVRVTIVEPGSYPTSFDNASMAQGEPLPAYDGVRARREELFAPLRGNRGNPAATGPAILELVDAQEPPLRVFFGAAPIEIIKPEYERRLQEWEQWDDLAKRAHGAPAAV
jgi:NAD(P)-dependent dehydrogenase (short-subunit alcohol dehydrogenase family)